MRRSGTRLRSGRARSRSSVVQAPRDGERGDTSAAGGGGISGHGAYRSSPRDVAEARRRQHADINWFLGIDSATSRPSWSTSRKPSRDRALEAEPRLLRYHRHRGRRPSHHAAATSTGHGISTSTAWRRERGSSSRAHDRIPPSMPVSGAALHGSEPVRRWWLLQRRHRRGARLERRSNTGRDRLHEEPGAHERPGSRCALGSERGHRHNSRELCRDDDQRNGQRDSSPRGVGGGLPAAHLPPAAPRG